MSELGEGVWAPFVELHRLVSDVLENRNVGRLPELEASLRRHKTSFIQLLKNPVPSAEDLATLKKASSEGISLGGDSGRQVLPQLIIDEAVIISNLFNLNQLAALHLLQTGEAQLPFYPGLTRGLVAILLYYDGRRALVTALKLLVQARKGVSWTSDLPENISALVTNYTDQILEENLLHKILELLSALDWERELVRLNECRGLGGARYLRQLSEMYAQTRQALADVVLCWAAQAPLSQPLTWRLVDYLAAVQVTEAAGQLPDVDLTLLMAALYSISVSRLLRHTDADDLVRALPLLKDESFAPALHRELGRRREETGGREWRTPALRTILQLGWAMSLSALRQLAVGYAGAGLASITEEDEVIADIAIKDQVFLSMREKMLGSKLFHTEEFFVRHVHELLTELLVAMPLKVKELRNRADEAARTVQMHQQEGLEPPANLPRHFEQLLQLLTVLYEKDPLGLGLSQEYWAIEGATQRQLSLHKFVRVAVEPLPAPLYVYYAELLAALASSPTTAKHCFALLTTGGSGAPLGVAQLFAQLHLYYERLVNEAAPLAREPYSAVPAASKNVTAQQLRAMVAGLSLIRVVAENDAAARLVMCESAAPPPVAVLLRLQTCAVPAPLKRQLLLTLAALARSPEVAQPLWHGLEQAQLLQTTLVLPGQQARGIKMELEEVEARAEQFPQTRAFLRLLATLVEAGVPAGLGAGLRAPGLHPYTGFVIHDVFLNYNSRAYKEAAEKYEVAADCLEILLRLVTAQEVTPAELGLTGGGADGSPGQPAPGAALLLQLMQRSKLLKLVLYTLDECARLLSEYRETGESGAVQRCSLLALQLLEAVLRHQPAVLTALRTAQQQQPAQTPLLPGLDVQLLAANPRTGTGDTMLVFTRFLGFSAWLPEHAAAAAGVLELVCTRPTAQDQLVALFSATEQVQADVTYAFVECLDSDAPEEAGSAAHAARCRVLDLLAGCLRLPGVTVAHLLLGLVGSGGLQEPGVLGAARTCLHALLAQLTAGLTATSAPSLVSRCPDTADKAYQVVYLLCAAPATSDQVLRYLRSAYDFVHGQLRPLPAAGTDQSEQLRHLTWLLRLLALELKVAAASQQRSQLQRLTALLLSSAPAAGPQLDLTGLDISLTLSQTLTGASASKPASTQRRKMLALLDQVNFSHAPLETPVWEYFEPAQVEEVIKSCEEAGSRQIDVKKLNAVLNGELAALQGTAALSQRPFIAQEIRAVLEHCVERNGRGRALRASADCVEAWRQVLEVLLTAVPTQLLTEHPDQVVMDVSRHILDKTLDPGSAAALTSPLSGTLLLLMTTLRAVGGPESQPPQSAGRLVTLRGIIDSLLRPESGRRGRQRTRAHLYGALLHLLAAEQGSGALADACRQYGRPLVETVCRDACGGHDVCRMLAMSCLDALLRADARWLQHLSGHGYLAALAESLAADDAPLCALLAPQPADPRPFYLYESKMSLLCRVAVSVEGARALLQTRLLQRLAELTALDRAPPPPQERGRQLLPPALRLCLALLAALGRENQSAVAQVTQFLLSHLDTVTSLLRHQPEQPTAETLEDVVLLTAVLSQASHEDVYADVSGSQLLLRRGQLSRLQQLTLAQLPRCVLTPQRLRQLAQLPERQLTACPRHEATVAALRVLSHLLLYAQGVMCRAGLRSPRLIFTASLAEKGGDAADAAPSLGCLVQVLRHHSDLLASGCQQLEQLQRRLDGSAQLDGQLLSELAGDDALPLGERRQRARTCLTRLSTLVTQQVELCRHVLELALHLLWTHLDAYLVRGRAAPAPAAGGPPLWQQIDAAGPDGDGALSAQLATQLKRELPLSLTDTLLAQVEAALQQPLVGRGHFSFSEAMVRRIRRVTRLHTAA